MADSHLEDLVRRVIKHCEDKESAHTMVTPEKGVDRTALAHQLEQRLKQELPDSRVVVVPYAIDEIKISKYPRRTL